MLDEVALYYYYHVVGAYIVSMAFLGTIGSILVFIVAFRLRDTTTFVFINFLAVTDALCLYEWNLDDFNYIYFSISLQESTLVGCKVMNFFQFTAMQSSAWLLVNIFS